jgi:hypothetical protein
MPIDRTSPTPSPTELDRLADVTPGDVERAKRRFRDAVASTPRRPLATLLDATTTDAGDAAGPLPDDGT